MTDISDADRTPVAPDANEDIQPLRDGDTSIEPDPARDPAQAEWDRTAAVADGVAPEDLDTATATGADPDEIPTDDDDIPAADLHVEADLPETQGEDPVAADLGETGQGDLSPEDI